MQSKFNKILTEIEQVIITIIQENRYSAQLVRSVKLLSARINIELERFDYSIDSLKIIDDYFNNVIEASELDIEICISATIYLSQVLILSCNGIWSIECESYSLHNETSRAQKMCVYSLWIETYNTEFITRPHYIFTENIFAKKSEIQQSIFLRALEIKSYEYLENYSNRYCLLGLDDFIKEGYDFYSDSDILISHLSTISSISEKRLNRSVNSLKLVENYIHNHSEHILIDGNEFDAKTFLSLIIYIGEVIIKSVNGEWKISADKFRTGAILSYHWNIKIFNSKGEELKTFIRDICDNLTKHTYDECRIKKIVELYIHANQQESLNKIEHIWRETKPYSKKRMWKTEHMLSD